MNPNTLKKAPRQKPVLAPSEIQKVLAIRESQKALKERLALIDEAVKVAEADLIAAIEAGADTSRLPYHVAVESSSRRYPSWKEEFISRLGKPEADAVIEATAPTVHRKLVIR